MLCPFEEQISFFFSFFFLLLLLFTIVPFYVSRLRVEKRNNNKIETVMVTVHYGN